MYTLGDYPRPDYGQSDVIIYWGRQPIYSGPVARPARAFLAAKHRGATIVAIKPSVEPDVGLADIWVPVRPGTDAALALAMLHVVIGEDLIDKTFVKQWRYGIQYRRVLNVWMNVPSGKKRFPFIDMPALRRTGVCGGMPGRGNNQTC